MANITELAAEIVSSHASTTAMTTDELIQEIAKVHACLKALESGESQPELKEDSASSSPEISLKDAFKKNEVICLECGKGGFKTLAKHLKTAHELTPKDYRKKFNIPSKQPLAAKTLTEMRRKSAKERNLGQNIEKAHQARRAMGKGK